MKPWPFVIQPQNIAGKDRLNHSICVVSATHSFCTLLPVLHPLLPIAMRKYLLTSSPTATPPPPLSLSPSSLPQQPWMWRSHRSYPPVASLSAALPWLRQQQLLPGEQGTRAQCLPPSHSRFGRCRHCPRHCEQDRGGRQRD